MSYQHERDAFIARMSTEGLPLPTTQQLLRGATTLNRTAELACSSEAANRDRVPCPGSISGKTEDCICDFGYMGDGQHATVPRIAVQDQRLERRLVATMPAGWRVITDGDPRGYVLRVIPPSYAERNTGRDRHNLDTIGVPNAPSRLRF